MRLAEPIPFIAAELRPLIRVDDDVLLGLRRHTAASSTISLAKAAFIDQPMIQRE